MRARIVNPTNSPFDLNGVGGLVRLPAFGEVTNDFDERELEAIRHWSVVEVHDLPQLDHDGDGEPGGVKDATPLSEDEKLELLEAMTDDELREFVEDRTGKKPHPNAKRETLLDKARA